VLQP
jgi:hypothetical protein